MKAPFASEGGLGFSLVAFGSDPAPYGLQLGGRLEQRGDQLAITYHLRGHRVSVVLPARGTADAPVRRDGLWEHTCFELFLAAEGMEPYWEVNLAPNGDWNVYRLAAYRQGLEPISDRNALPFHVQCSDHRQSSDQALEPNLALDLGLDLTLPLPEELVQACQQRALLLAITAVIEHPGGDLSYWALAHGGEEADFHRREDFLLRLAFSGQRHG